MTTELLRYRRQVGKNLNCPKPMRDKFLIDTKRMTDDFFAENPGATLDELRNAIGEPGALAAMFLESADSDAVEGYRKRKIWAKRVAVMLLAAAFAAATALAIYYYTLKQDAVITKESTLIIYESDGSIGHEIYEGEYEIVP